jgi:hypothetical protein
VVLQLLKVHLILLCKFLASLCLHSDSSPKSVDALITVSLLHEVEVLREILHNKVLVNNCQHNHLERVKHHFELDASDVGVKAKTVDPTRRVASFAQKPVLYLFVGKLALLARLEDRPQGAVVLEGARDGNPTHDLSHHVVYYVRLEHLIGINLLEVVKTAVARDVLLREKGHGHMRQELGVKVVFGQPGQLVFDALGSNLINPASLLFYLVNDCEKLHHRFDRVQVVIHRVHGFVSLRQNLI